MKSLLHSLAIVMVLALIIAGCAPDADVSTALPEQPPVRAITYQQTYEFSKEVMRRIRQEDISPLDSIFDREAWLERAAYTMGKRKPVLAALDSMARDLSPGAALMKLASSASDMKLLGVEWNDGRPRARYKFSFSRGGFDYFLVMYGEDRQGRLRVIDYHALTDIDPMSVRARRIANSRPSIFDAFSRRGTVTLGTALDSLSILWDDVRYRKMLDYCDSLPDPIKYDRYILPFRIVAAHHVSPSEVERALGILYAHYAGYKDMGILLAGYFFVKKQHDSALRALDIVDSVVGGDPYLDLLRAGVAREAGDDGLKRMYLRRAITKDSTMVAPYVLLLEEAIADRKFAEAARITSDIRNRFRVLMTPEKLGLDSELAARPAFKEYVASKELAKVLREHPDRGRAN